MTEQQKRATFEDVCKAQDTLLQFIDDCISENKALDARDRVAFIRLFRLATLGIGSEHTFVLQGKQRSYHLGHVGHASYWIAYRTTSQILLGQECFDIKQLWLQLRDHCFQLFPKAQEISIKMSKELVDLYTGTTSSFDYGDL